MALEKIYFTENEILLKVFVSTDKDTGRDVYRIFDIYNMIPKPEKLIGQPEVRLNTSWEKMYFNHQWGDTYDPEGRGAWLKQKKSKYFKIEVGVQKFKIRYQLR